MWTSLCDLSLHCFTTSIVEAIPAFWHTMQSKSSGSMNEWLCYSMEEAQSLIHTHMEIRLQTLPNG